jgi:glycosyltransferase 2 family protein
MTEDSPPIISSSTKKFILASALLSYVALILFILYSVGIDELVAVIGRMNAAIYALAILSLIISLTFHTLVWFQLLKALSLKLGFRKTYKLYWVGVFVDNLIPGGWSGDLFKAYLLNKDPNVESGKAVASVVAKNMYEAIFNLGSMIFGIVLLLLNYTLEGYLLISLGGIMILLTLPLVILLGASFRPEAAKKIVAAGFRVVHALSGKRRNLWELQAKVEKALGDYHEGMDILLKKPGMLFKPMILSFFAWAFEVITLLFVFASLGQLVPLDKVIIVRSIAGNIEAQGYAFVGYAQIVTSEIYRALGVPIVTGISVALLGGVLVFFIKTAISYAAFHRTIFAAHNSKLDKERN